MEFINIEEKCVENNEKPDNNSNNNDSAATISDNQNTTQNNPTNQIENKIIESVNISDEIKDVTSDFVPIEKLKMLSKKRLEYFCY